MKSAFTLIELLVVISIIALLSSVVLAGLSDAREKAVQAKALAFERDLHNQLYDNLVAEWTFDEGQSGSATGATLFDNSETGYDGTGVGGVTFTNGILNGALSFNGSTGYVNVANSATGALDFPEEGTFTIAAWVNVTALTSNHRPIVTKGDYQYILKINTSNQWVFFDFADGVGWQQVIAPASTGWHHVVGVRDGADMRLYVDGQLVDDTITPLASALPRNTTYNINIGRNSSNTSRFFNGAIDNVRIYNAAYTP